VIASQLAKDAGGIRRWKGKSMLALIKLAVGSVFALCILSPSFTPRSDTCECKAKALTQTVPRADTCECKAKAN